MRAGALVPGVLPPIRICSASGLAPTFFASSPLTHPFLLPPFSPLAGLEAQRDNEAREIAEKVIDMLHLCDEKKRNTLEAEARGVIGSVYLNADDLNNALREHEAVCG